MRNGRTPAGTALTAFALTLVLGACPSKQAPAQKPPGSARPPPLEVRAVNAIVETRVVKSGDGKSAALMIAVNINDPATADAYVSEVAESFKLSRMSAPPETSMMLVTLIGDQSADRFARQWRAIAEHDDIIRAFMARMTVADVIQGTADGRQLSKASLLAL